MVAGLIISIISVFIVIGISTAVYVQNRSQASTYDKKLTEVVTKTNNANQYEYEKNKDQEVSLDKIRNDVQSYDKRMTNIQNDFNYIKGQQASQIARIQKTIGDFQTTVDQNSAKIDRINNDQNTQINGMNNSLTGAIGEIKSINDKVTVINGQLVNIGQKQQSQIDALSKDASAIKAEQGALRDTVFNIKNENVSRLQEQSKLITDFTSTSVAKMNTQDASIKAVTDKANSVENIVNTLNGSLSALKNSLNNYMTKDELAGAYASKADLGAVDTKFGNYLTTTDFNTFKANLPDYPTRTEMKTLVTSFITKQDIATITSTIAEAQKALTDLSGMMNTIKTTYATKDDLMRITGDSSSGTVNIASLSVTLQGIQDGLKALQASVTATSNTLTTYKSDSANTFATKNELANLNNAILSQLNAIKSGTASILDTLTVNKSFVSNGDAVINGTRMSKGWTGYPDNATDRSEISNDIGGYKKLMIVGNKSAGAERRVGVWDRLDVHGNLGVDEWADAKNINAREHVRTGGDAWKTWMRYTGDMYASNKLGVGISPDHSWYRGNQKQAIFNGGGNDDWQLGARNPNGDRWFWVNHGDGYGMHINTNDQRGDRYSMQLWNGKKDTLKVMNDGTMYTTGKINPDSWTDFNYVKVGQGPAWNPGENVDATGTWIHKDGQVRSRNTTENDWIHKVYGREHINMHLLNNQGYGMHLNTRNNEAGKYALQTYNRDYETFRITNDGKAFVQSKLGVGIDPNHEWLNNRQAIVNGSVPDWQFGLHNANGERWLWANHGDGYGMHINTNDQRGDRYALQLHNGQREILTVFNGGEKRWQNRNGNWTHWDYPDGRNYIRNETIVDGNLKVNGAFCIGGTCIGEGELAAMLRTREGQNVRLQSVATGRQLENGGGATGGAIVGTYNWDGDNNKRWRIYGA